MPRPVRFRTRRLLSSMITLLAVLILYRLTRQQHARLEDISFSTGYLLLSLVLFLLAFHWRKWLNVLPLGSAALWMQLHIYVGLTTAPLFWWHINGRFPDGIFERILASCFLLTFVSGLWGLYLTRTVPRRLAVVREQFLFERIPAYDAQIQYATRRLILKAVQEHGSSTLANFYQQRLDAYFDTRRNLRFLLFPTPTARRRVMSDLAGVQRYLTDTERQVSEQLFHLIRKKDELDYQYALQLLLKMWLFIHLTLSYSLSVFVAWHVILTHAFHGGWR